MTVNAKENSKYISRILASILSQKIITREENAYFDHDTNTLMINSTMTIKRIAGDDVAYNPMAPNITFVTDIKVPEVVLDFSGITVDDSNGYAIRISSNKSLIDVTIDTHHIESFDFREEFTKGYLFSESYSPLLGVIGVKNKRLTKMMDKIATRKFNWSIDYDISSKIYTATVKANVSIYKDKMESHSMCIEDSTNVFAHTSAIGIIDELLATPYEFHGTCINYNAIDYTRRSGKFVLDKISCENEATKILLDVANATTDIAKRLI